MTYRAADDSIGTENLCARAFIRGEPKGRAVQGMVENCSLNFSAVASKEQRTTSNLPAWLSSC